MGGNTFDDTKDLTQEEYESFISLINKLGLVENKDYLLPFRLSNKNTYGDFDIILSDTDKFINPYNQDNPIKELKTIPLFEERFNLYSKHILTDNDKQIDLLKSWNQDSMEITRAYYSYSFANIFLKRLTTIADRNLKFSFLGLFCSSNKFVIPDGVNYIQIDPKTRLIIDCDYVFGLLDLDYSRYKLGFADEIELLNYFSKSKYYPEIKFKSNSKFKHDYSRLKPFASLVDGGLIQVENFELE